MFTFVFKVKIKYRYPVHVLLRPEQVNMRILNNTNTITQYM